jgi:two-component system nitrate/nitrite response regulator NarL
LVRCCGRGAWGGGRYEEPLIPLLLMARTRAHCEALAATLEARSMITVVATATSIQEAAAAVREHKPKVALVDAAFPEAVTGSRTIARAGTTVKIVAYGVSRSAAEIVAWAEAGALGCVAQDASLEEIASSVEAAARGDPSCSPGLAAAVFHHIAAAARPASRAAADLRLTSREREILRLVASGLSNKEIAQALCVQIPTVKNHLQHVFRKLGISRREDARAWIAIIDGPEPARTDPS